MLILVISGCTDNLENSGEEVRRHLLVNLPKKHPKTYFYVPAASRWIDVEGLGTVVNSYMTDSNGFVVNLKKYHK